jgi:hypothetical protein
MTEIDTLKARMEALAHATAVLLADRLAGLEPNRAAQACAVFASPFAIQNDTGPRRGVMLDTLEDIAERALILAVPQG